jgi:hypothetical protein
LLRCNLIAFVDDSASLEIPAAVLVRIIDFKPYEERPEDYARLFTFCVEYLRVVGSSASQIMRRLDMTRLSNHDVGRLLAFDELNWGVLNESVCRYLIRLRQELFRERELNAELRHEVEEQLKAIRIATEEEARERNENAAMKAANDDQQRRIETLEEVRMNQEGVIRRQASEIKSLETEKQKSEDGLKVSIEANEAQKRALGRLRDEIKAMKAAMSTLARPFAPKSDPLDGIIAHLSRECGGNVHNRDCVAVTASKSRDTGPAHHARNVVDLKSGSMFDSDGLDKHRDIPHARNNWICYDFKNRRIIPTHYSIRSRYDGGVWASGSPSGHLKNWVVETSMGGENWTEIDHKENNSDLHANDVTRIYEVAASKVCRFVKLVNIGRNHCGASGLVICAWEIFGFLIERDGTDESVIGEQAGD